MGLSFLISQQTKELQATIHWGDYLPIELEEDIADQEPDDKKKRKPQGWKRIPQTATLTVPIAASKDATEDSFEIEIPGGSGLALVVNNRPVHDARFAAGTLSVSIFVVNYRKMQFSEKDTTFAFQTCLVVQCKEGFVPRSDLRGVDSDDWDEAVASLQYRHDYEFAVGHNVSALAHTPRQNTLTPSPSPMLSITQKSLKRMPYKPFRDQLHLHQSQLLGCFRLNQEANSRFVRFPIADWLKLAII